MTHRPVGSFGPACLAAGLAVAAVLSLPSRAAAQTEAELERARAMFAEGVRLADQSRWPRAVERFRAAAEIRPAPPVLYNLAAALVELGEGTEPWELTGRVLADPTTSEELRASATALRARIEALLSRVSVTVHGAMDGVEVRVAGRVVSAQELAAPIVVTPGPTVIEAYRGAARVAGEEPLVARGATVRVRLVIPPDPAAAAQTVEEPGAGPEPGVMDGSEPGPALTEDWRFWAAVGGGVVVVAVVIGVAVAASGTEEPIRGDFMPGTITWR